MTLLNTELRLNHLEKEVKELTELIAKVMEDIADLMKMMEENPLYKGIRRIG